jgi:dolichol-phosphate mannosyltransferase
LPPHLYILLPAYNEERALRQLVPEITTTLKGQGRSFTIYIVNDASQDGTTALLETLSNEAPLCVIRHLHNQGYGAAIRSGIFAILDQAKPEDIVVTMDADNTHSPVYIAELAGKLEEGYGVVTASYTLPDGKAYRLPVKRRVLSWGANTLLRCVFRFPGVGTYTNGFRAFRVNALQAAFRQYGDRLIEETNFPGGTELFLKVVRAGARAGELPFILYYERRGLDSKINIPRTIKGYLQLIRLART